MLAIKFKRIGKKGQPSFRVIVIEKRLKIHGRFTADLGWYNSRTDQFSIENDLAKDWILKGAQPTDSVHNLLVKAGVIAGAKKPVHHVRSKTSEASADALTRRTSNVVHKKAALKVETSAAAPATATVTSEKTEEKSAV